LGNRLVDIHLHGPLADKYGALHRFAINNPREAVHALDANFPGFVSDFVKHERYAIYADGDWRDFEGAEIAPFGREVHFCPQVEGGAFLATALIGAIIPSIAGTTAATILGSVLMTGLLIGISFLFRPKQPKKKDEAKDESFAFSGPENVTGQGVAVPLIYGRVYAGSVVISAGQSTTDIMTTPPVKANPPPAAPNKVKPPATVMPPNRVPGGGHSRSLSAAGVGTVNSALHTAGAGVSLLEGEDEDDIQYEEGWPEIIEDPVYGWRPDKGWIISSENRVTEEDDVNRKTVITWQPPYWTYTGSTYCWNMNRGFYMDDVGIGHDEWEWVDGAEAETPIVNPSE
jgi:predicted phage tail protein